MYHARYNMLFYTSSTAVIFNATLVVVIFISLASVTLQTSTATSNYISRWQNDDLQDSCAGVRDYLYPSLSEELYSTTNMAGKRKSSANTAGGKKSKQQKGTGIAQTIKAAWGIKSHDVINSKYENERVLLKAKECYDNGKVPPEEKEYLFEYYVSGVNKDDNNTATLKYNGKFIKNGGDTFEAYPDSEVTIKTYRLALFKEDHELYNKHVARVNAKKNDALDMRKAELQKKEKEQLNDVSDIVKRITVKEESAVVVLEDEFEPKKDATTKEVIGSTSRTIGGKGVDAGKVTYSQTWGKCC